MHIGAFYERPHPALRENVMTSALPDNFLPGVQAGDECQRLSSNFALIAGAFKSRISPLNPKFSPRIFSTGSRMGLLHLIGHQSPTATQKINHMPKTNSINSNASYGVNPRGGSIMAQCPLSGEIPDR